MEQYILLIFSFHDIAQQKRVKLCITVDGAELTKDLSHLTFVTKATAILMQLIQGMAHHWLTKKMNFW
jgi:hypothetical protein